MTLEFKPVLHSDTPQAADIPKGVRILRVGKDDYIVQVKIVRLNGEHYWEQYGPIVHAVQIAVEAAQRLRHPYAPKVIEVWDD